MLGEPLRREIALHDPKDLLAVHIIRIGYHAWRIVYQLNGQIPVFDGPSSSKPVAIRGVRLVSSALTKGLFPNAAATRAKPRLGRR